MTAGSMPASVGIKVDVLTPPWPWQATQFIAMKAPRCASPAANRTAGPSDPSRRAQSGYWFLRGCSVGAKAKPTANCVPEIERGAVLLITAKNAKAEDGGDDH